MARAGYNPEEQNAGLNRAVEKLLRINREKVYPRSRKSTEAGEAAEA
jgi:hypothetical protein